MPEPDEELQTCRAALAAERRRVEQLAEIVAAGDRAEEQLRDLVAHLDRHLTGAERDPGGVRGWAKRRLVRGVASPSEAAELAELRASSLFDPVWYLRTYPEVAATGLSPALHYLRHGATEGKDPGPGFSTTRYLGRHPMVARRHGNPLLNHLRTGQ